MSEKRDYLISQVLKDAVGKMYADLLGYVTDSKVPDPPALTIDALMKAKAELEKLPKPILAVKIHPDMEGRLRRTLYGIDHSVLFYGPEVFVDSNMPRGWAITTREHHVVLEWRRHEWRKELLRVLRRRMAALGEEIGPP